MRRLHAVHLSTNYTFAIDSANCCVYSCIYENRVLPHDELLGAARRLVAGATTHLRDRLGQRHDRARADRMCSGSGSGFRCVELRRAPLLAEAVDAQPHHLGRGRRPEVSGRADRGVRHRPSVEQPGPDRRGVLDARQPPRRTPPHRNAARHAQRVPHLRLQPVGVAGSVRGGDPAAQGVLHRARAVRLGRSVLPISQHRGVAAPGARPTSAHPDLRQQQGRCDLRRAARSRSRVLVHACGEVRGAR